MTNPPPTFYNAKSLDQVNSLIRGIVTYLRRKTDKPPVNNYNSDTAALTEDDNTHLRFDCTAASLNYYVDTALPLGWRVDVSKIDSSVHTLTIGGTGVTINDPSLGSVASVVISTQFESLTLVCVAPKVFDIV